MENQKQIARVCHCTLYMFNPELCEKCFDNSEILSFKAKDFNIFTITTETDNLTWPK